MFKIIHTLGDLLTLSISMNPILVINACNSLYFNTPSQGFRRGLCLDIRRVPVLQWLNLLEDMSTHAFTWPSGSSLDFVSYRWCSYRLHDDRTMILKFSVIYSMHFNENSVSTYEAKQYSWRALPFCTACGRVHLYSLAPFLIRVLRKAMLVMLKSLHDSNVRSPWITVCNLWVPYTSHIDCYCISIFIWYILCIFGMKATILDIKMNVNQIYTICPPCYQLQCTKCYHFDSALEHKDQYFKLH